MRPGDVFHLSQVPALDGGEPKGRYVIVVTAEEDIGLDKPIYVVACSASVLQTQGEVVELPWHPLGQARTGFRRQTWAIPIWMLKVRPSQLGDYKGHIPHDKLAVIIDQLPLDPCADLSQSRPPQEPPI